MRKKHYSKVVIVGAGIAGISAGITLYENGIEDILILEAQPMVGGRIRTIKIDEELVELGAQWLHGTQNELWTLASQHELISPVNSYEGTGNFYRSLGEVVSSQLVQEVKNIVSDIELKLRTCNIKELLVNSVGEFLSSEFEKYLDCSEDTSEVKRTKRELLDWHFRYFTVDNSCSSLFNLSSHRWREFKYCGGENFVNLQNGFSSLVDILVARLPKHAVRTNTSVRTIKWKPLSKSPSNICQIITNDDEVFLADHVIVTCSVGFLKKNWNMFQPQIPTTFINAFSHIGFGTINKIFLKYEEPWWGDLEGIQLVWNSKERSKQIGGDDMVWTCDLTGFQPVTNLPNLLLGWVGGQGAKILEKLPSGTVAQHCTLLLRELTGRPNIPSPVYCLRTAWFTNKYTKGSYSHLNVGKAQENLDIKSILQKPVWSEIRGSERKHPSLLFAGEAIHTAYYSTTHGAFESGRAQAQQLLQYINKLP